MWVRKMVSGKPVRNARMSPCESVSVMLSWLGIYSVCSNIPSMASFMYMCLSTLFVFALRECPLLTPATTPKLLLRTRTRAWWMGRHVSTARLHAVMRPNSTATASAQLMPQGWPGPALTPGVCFQVF
jgi:hypothetical protein